jgi:hypothetical protein
VTFKKASSNVWFHSFFSLSNLNRGIVRMASKFPVVELNTSSDGVAEGEKHRKSKSANDPSVSIEE